VDRCPRLSGRITALRTELERALRAVNGTPDAGPIVEAADEALRLVMAAHRAPYQQPDVLGALWRSDRDAISSYTSYCGRFEVLADQDTVIHHIEVCSYPNWVGDAQARSAKLNGDLLTLSTEPMTFQGAELRAELVWERVGAG
jgi:hypothetical protein